jgi:hypothetical protein
MIRNIFSGRRAATAAACALALAAGGAVFVQGAQSRPARPIALAADVQAGHHMTGVFHGAKVNGGTATHFTRNGKSLLTLSGDFKIPDTPAPHWQVVDSAGNTYLLQRLKIKGDKVNNTIEVPPYVPDVAKVQIWCAWAEVLLGEASFDSPVK